MVSKLQRDRSRDGYVPRPNPANTPRPSTRSADTGGAAGAEGPRRSIARPNGDRDFAERERQAGLQINDGAPRPQRAFGGIGAQDGDRAIPNPLTVTRSGGRVTIEGTAGNDDIRVRNRTGGGVIVQSGSQRIELTDAEARNLEIRGGRGNDNIRVDQRVNYDITLDGGAGNDTLRGGRGNDNIGGGAGDDRIIGGQGNDTLEGGDGRDRIDGGRGRDTIRGGGGDDTVRGGAGDDNLDGGAGNDRIQGGRGNDTIEGGAGNDRIRGDAGNDVIRGSAGDDDIRGGAGNDEVHGGAGNDRIRGDAGDDQIHGDDGNDDIRGGAGHDTLHGDGGNDRIRGEGGNDRIRGGDGDDNLDGGSGRDHIYGNDGTDTIRGGAGRDWMSGGRGNDTLDGGGGDDVMYGLEGNDTMRGGTGNDYMDGGRGDDTMRGGQGNDALMGGRGNDRMFGQAGRDTLAGGHGTDRFDGGAGRDRIYHERNETVDNQGRSDLHQEVDMRGADPGSSVVLNDGGNTEWRRHTESDLDAMRSLPTGRRLLSQVDANPNTVTLQPGASPVTGYDNPGNRFQDPTNTTNGPGTNATITHNHELTNSGLPGRQERWEEFNPVVALGHEMVHAENAQRGAMPNGSTDGERNRERIAVGLPIDHDGRAQTPRINPNDGRFTENMLREELNMGRRTSYIPRRFK